MMRSSILSEINDCLEDEDEDESEQSCNFPIVINDNQANIKSHQSSSNILSFEE